MSAALAAFNALPSGGMGHYNDLLPYSVFEHEDDGYVWAVFEGLSERWERLMSILEREAP